MCAGISNRVCRSSGVDSRIAAIVDGLKVRAAEVGHLEEREPARGNDGKH